METEPIIATTGDVAGGRAWAIYHDGCTKPMNIRNDKRVEGKVVTCECGKKVKLAEHNGIWD